MLTPTQTEIVLIILTGVRDVVRPMSWLDNPLDVEEVFAIVAEGLRIEPGSAVEQAKSRLDAAVLHEQAGQDTVPAIDQYLAGDPTLLYQRLLFERGKQGLVECLDEAIDAAKIPLYRAQVPLWIP